MVDQPGALGVPAEENQIIPVKPKVRWWKLVSLGILVLSLISAVVVVIYQNRSVEMRRKAAGITSMLANPSFETVEERQLTRKYGANWERGSGNWGDHYSMIITTDNPDHDSSATSGNYLYMFSPAYLTSGWLNYYQGTDIAEAGKYKLTARTKVLVNRGRGVKVNVTDSAVNTVAGSEMVFTSENWETKTVEFDIAQAGRYQVNLLTEDGSQAYLDEILLAKGAACGGIGTSCFTTAGCCAGLVCGNTVPPSATKKCLEPMPSLTPTLTPTPTPTGEPHQYEIDLDCPITPNGSSCITAKCASNECIYLHKADGTVCFETDIKNGICSDGVCVAYEEPTVTPKPTLTPVLTDVPVDNSVLGGGSKASLLGNYSFEEVSIRQMDRNFGANWERGSGDWGDHYSMIIKSDSNGYDQSAPSGNYLYMFSPAYLTGGWLNYYQGVDIPQAGKYKLTVSAKVLAKHGRGVQVSVTDSAVNTVAGSSMSFTTIGSWENKTVEFDISQAGRYQVNLLTEDGSQAYFDEIGLTGGEEAAVGEKIVFTSRMTADDINTREIFIMNPDGQNLVRLTENSFMDWQSDLSNDGKKIAFTSKEDGSEEVFIMNADGSGRTQLTATTGSDSSFYPDFSSDGNRIVFVSNLGDNEDIYVMNADGSGQVRLTDNAARDSVPDFSPDGSKIAFGSDRDGNWDIYVMNADGSGQTRLTHTEDGHSSARSDFSPDGSKIAFGSDRDGNRDIYVMNADGSGQTRLTDNPKLDANPCFSPDGSKIAFTSDRDGNEEIYVMNADGSGQTQITDLNTSSGGASWGGGGEDIPAATPTPKPTLPPTQIPHQCETDLDCPITMPGSSCVTAECRSDYTCAYPHKPDGTECFETDIGEGVCSSGRCVTGEFCVYLNEASGQSCEEVCGEKGTTCLSIGTDLNGEGMDYYTYSQIDGGCVDQAGLCDTRINELSPSRVCDGKSANWTYCRCDGACLVSPTPPATCNVRCVDNQGCSTGLICYNSYCRNSQCLNETDCVCPSPTPTLSPTPTPPAGDALTMKIRLQGIDRKAKDQLIRVIFKKGNQTAWTDDLAFTADNSGKYSVTVAKPDELAAGDYKVFFKGRSHLQKQLPGVGQMVAIGDGDTMLDFTTSGLSMVLKAGDTMNVGSGGNAVFHDNKITLEDITAIVIARGNNFSVAATPATINLDINADGFITIQDIALAIMNWSDEIVPGDE